MIIDSTQDSQSSKLLCAVDLLASGLYRFGKQVANGAAVPEYLQEALGLSLQAFILPAMVPFPSLVYLMGSPEFLVKLMAEANVGAELMAQKLAVSQPPRTASDESLGPRRPLTMKALRQRQVHLAK